MRRSRRETQQGAEDGIAHVGGDNPRVEPSYEPARDRAPVDRLVKHNPHVEPSDFPESIAEA